MTFPKMYDTMEVVFVLCCIMIVLFSFFYFNVSDGNSTLCFVVDSS